MKEKEKHIHAVEKMQEKESARMEKLEIRKKRKNGIRLRNVFWPMTSEIMEKRKRKSGESILVQMENSKRRGIRN